MHPTNLIINNHTCMNISSMTQFPIPYTFVHSQYELWHDECQKLISHNVVLVTTLHRKLIIDFDYDALGGS